MRRHARKIAALAAAAAAVSGGVVVAATSAGGSTTKSAAVSVLQTARPAQVDDQTLNALKDAGFAARPDASVLATASDGTDLRIVPGADGGACVVSPNGAAACGDQETLVRSAIVGIYPDEDAARSVTPAGVVSAVTQKPGIVSPARPAPRGGTIDVRGLTSDDVVSVAVVDREGDVVGTGTSVENNVFALNDVPFADAWNVRVTRKDGTTGDLPLS